MVKIYDDTIPANLCKELIEIFERSKQDQEYVNSDHCPCFTQLNVYRISSGQAILKVLIPYMHKVYNQYRLDIEQSNYLPQFKHLEEFRVKRYLTGGDERFDEHVDVTDTVSSARALAFLVYLNENDGNTLFPSQNLNIEPISGRVIVFPPTWEYPHEGLAPKSNPKYIMSTYVHYGKN